MTEKRIEPDSDEDFPSEKLGPMFSPTRHEWSMYSYDRPADIFWAAYCRRLKELGWTDGEILALVQSKFPRHAMDGNWTDAIEGVARNLAVLTKRSVLDAYVTPTPKTPSRA